MSKLPKNIAKVLVSAMPAAFLLLGQETALAVSPTQPQQPRIFTPNCAAPPRCIEHLCLRMGRCSFGSHTQAMGCLIYACKHSVH